MNLELKPLHQQILVITGATSGIGLATTRKAVRRGARVVINARGDDALRQLEHELNTNGMRAVAVPGDVSSQSDLNQVARTATERFGGFDTWVNNAGVSIFGEIRDVPIEAERRVFEVNYWGAVYGSRIAVEHLRQRGGALINVGSVVSDTTVPLQAAYSASKHALKAYTTHYASNSSTRVHPCRSR